MSENILNNIKSNESQLKSLNKRLENQVRAKENEIEKIKAYQESQKAGIKEDFKIDLMNLKKDHQAKIFDETNSFEKRINNYKEKLDKVQSQIKESESILKENQQKNLNNIKKDMNQELSQAEHQARIDTAAKIDLTKQKTQEINSNARYELEKLEKNTAQKILNYSAEQNERILQNEDFFQKISKDTITKNQNNLEVLKKETENANNKELKNLNKTHHELKISTNNQIEHTKLFQKTMLEQMDNDFKERVKNMNDNHISTLNDITKRFKEDLEKLTNKTTTQKKTFLDKSNDSFYQVSVLDPKLIDNQDHVLLNIPVAEFEKNNLFVSAEGRNIKITLNRKYDNFIKDSDQSINRTTRSELFSKELSVSDILSPRGITQQYQDGILSVKILKA